MPLTPFEAGKTAEELGIDTTRKFVVAFDEIGPFKKGDIVKVFSITPDGTVAYCEKPGTHYRYLVYWSELAYASQEEQTTEVYEPKVGDRVSLEGEVVVADPSGVTKIEFNGRSLWLNPVEMVCANVKLLSRKSPRKVSMQEIKEHFGQDIIIED